MAEFLKKILIFVLVVVASITVLKILHGIVSWIELLIGLSIGVAPLIVLVIVLSVVVVLLLISGSVSHREKAPNRDYWEISANPKGADLDPFKPTNENTKSKNKEFLRCPAAAIKQVYFILERYRS